MSRWLDITRAAAELRHASQQSSDRAQCRLMWKSIQSGGHGTVLERSEGDTKHLASKIHALGNPAVAERAKSPLMDLSAIRCSLGQLIRDGLSLLALDAKDGPVKRASFTSACGKKFEDA